MNGNPKCTGSYNEQNQKDGSFFMYYVSGSSKIEGEFSGGKMTENWSFFERESRQRKQIESRNFDDQEVFEYDRIMSFIDGILETRK